MAGLGIVAIVLLGILNVIDKSTASALLGGLFGYVLGNAAHSQSGSTSGTTGTGKENETTKNPGDGGESSETTNSIHRK